MSLNSRIPLGAAVAISVLAFAGAASALTGVTGALKQTQSQSWQTRAAGVQAIEDADDAGQATLSDTKVRGALIALLQRETGFHDSRQHYGESYSDYYSDLLTQVASWKDARALPVLMDARVITTGGIAIRGVAAFGDSVVAPVAARYKASREIDERVAYLVVLDRIAANRAPLSSASAQLMRNLLLAASRDSEPIVRVGAVRGLAMFRDNFTRETLKSIAARDPFVTQKGARPVRVEATRALTALNGKGPRTSTD